MVASKINPAPRAAGRASGYHVLPEQTEATTCVLNLQVKIITRRFGLLPSLAGVVASLAFREARQ